MNDPEPISTWIEELKEGDAEAINRLWKHYYPRLVGLARKKLGDSSRRSMDEEDVVQTAFDGFCRRARAGLFPDLHDRQSLWSLLVVIVARKAASQRSHERRVKRGGGRSTNELFADESYPAASDLAPYLAAEPSPAEAAALVEELEQFMDSLADPADRLLLLWKLEQRTNAEIARHLNCSLSGVERRLRQVRKRLADVIQGS